MNWCWRLCALLSVLALVACASRDAAPPLPDSASFGWQLKSTVETPKTAAPAPVRDLGFRKSWRAEYAGPGKALVDIYEVPSEANALEMIQKWRPAADTVTFFGAHYFVVVHWEGADREAVRALVGSLEKSLKG
jgi:hypothetical protein